MATFQNVSPIDRFSIPDRQTLGIIAFLLNLQLVGIVLYYILSDIRVSDPRYLLYGLLWVNVGVYILYRASVPSGISFRTRRIALAISSGYFGLLAVFGGLIGTGIPENVPGGLRIAWLTPGWGPAVVYGGELITIVLMPAYFIGYLALTYLIYITVLEASGSSIAGLLGLLSCVSCSWPILAAIGAAFFGGSGVLATTALESSYELSTIIFLVTAVILYFRPGFR